MPNDEVAGVAESENPADPPDEITVRAPVVDRVRLGLELVTHDRHARAASVFVRLRLPKVPVRATVAPPRVAEDEALRVSVLWLSVAAGQDYKAFVDGGGYAEDELWEAGRPEANEKEPDEWHSQGFHPNRPVTGVSWFEAMAFCRWASGAWGLEVDLPSEAELEFAARGREGRPYPWGEEEPGEGDGARANYGFQIGHPTPVGAFPNGNYGSLVDMAGNVWEWCYDEWSEQGSVEAPAAASSRGAPRVVRVVRGGSWSFSPWFLRCAIRVRFPPEDRYQYLGFRVVCRGSRQP